MSDAQCEPESDLTVEPSLAAGVETAAERLFADRGELAARATFRPSFQLLGGTAILLLVFAWAYYPTIVELVKSWRTQPDYSHGYLVVPLALFFLWAKRDRFPGLRSSVSWAGLTLIFVSIAVRFLGARWFLGSVDAWSMLFWVAGVVWLLCGRWVLWWSLPSIAFLWFMIPLPYSAERMLSLPLQKIATRLSVWVLQTLGQPAWAAGNTILIGADKFEVAQACSGLRIFVGITALAFAYAVLVRRSWWERALILASTIPIALVANATRVVVTVLLFQHVSGEASKKFSHDFAGLAMIVYATALFALVVWYLGKVVGRIEQVDVSSVVARSRHEPTGEAS